MLHQFRHYASSGEQPWSIPELVLGKIVLGKSLSFLWRDPTVISEQTNLVLGLNAGTSVMER